MSVRPQKSTVDGGEMHCSCTDLPCRRELPSLNFLLYWQCPQALLLHFGDKSSKHKDSCGSAGFFFQGQG